MFLLAEKARAKAIDFKKNPDARSFRTRLSEALHRGVNFAGHYAVAGWGCGTGCISGAIIDARTGNVFWPEQFNAIGVLYSEGEYANVNPSEPLIILGEVDTLQIRADVDEQNAWQVRTNEPAVAFLKGDTKHPLPIRFVRIEPYVVPKKSLTGDSAERVDTRVLQIIFELDRPAVPLYVGQQVDVFIQRPASRVEPEASATKP